MTVDPFAQVAAGSAGTSTATTDGFLAARDSADPFATSSDYKGGDYTPSPPIETLRGRLLAMFARDFNPTADDPFNPGKTRELYTVDLYILDGGPLKFDYKIKADPERGTEERYETLDAGDVSPANVFAVTRFWVPQGNLINKLKQTHRDGAPFLGVLDLVPQKADRDKGKTAAQLRAEYDGWVGRNRVGAAPKFSWAMDDPTPERRKLAIGWWATVKDSIEPIDRSKAPAK